VTSPTAARTEHPTPGAPSCAPWLALDDHSITYGESVTGHVTGKPGDHVSIRAYSRPSTSYGVVRGEAVLPASGWLDYTFRPATNTRMYAVSPTCGASNTSTIAVHGLVSIAAHRDGVRSYTFSGAAAPAAAYEGQLVKLFFLRGSTPVQKGSGRVHAGKIAIAVQFRAPGRFTFFLAAPANNNNAVARSTNRPTVIS
jgi:hypothetical protein